MPKPKMTAPQEKARREFRARLKTRMAQLHLTQSELATRLGMSQSSISDWFNPLVGSAPDGDAMMALPEVLAANGHWLLTGEGPMQPNQAGRRDRELRAEGAHVVIGEVRRVMDSLEQDLSGTLNAHPHVQSAVEGAAQLEKELAKKKPQSRQKRA